MRKYLVLMLSVLSLNMGCAQSVEKNTNTKFIDFVKSFKEDSKSSIIDFRRTIKTKASMSKEEALNFVYYTSDTTKLYCVDFDYSNENEEFRGISGTSLYLPDKCLKIDMGDYFFIAYNSYQCINNIKDCPDPNNFRDCFLNGEFYVLLTLCIVDKEFNLRDSMLVCKENDYEFFVKGLLNSQNGRIFLDKTEDNSKNVYFYIVNKDLKFELIKERNVGRDVYTDDLMKVLKKLEWEEFFK